MTASSLRFAIVRPFPPARRLSQTASGPAPRSSRAATRFEPMKPAPPVTTIMPLPASRSTRRGRL